MPTLAVNGIDIAYEIAGRPGEPAVLLIMGLGGSMVAWPDELFYAIADRGFYVIRFDNRDAGRSTNFHVSGVPNVSELYAKLMKREPTLIPYSLDDMADDAAGLLAGLRIESAHVVGMSMGGMIAQLLALNHPTQVKSLTSIMSTTGRRGLPPSDAQTMAALMTPPKSGSTDDRLAQSLTFLKAITGPDFHSSDDQLRAYAERGVNYSPFDPGAVARQMSAVMFAEPRHARLAGIRVPTLIVHGTHDPLLPLAHGEDTAVSILGSRLEIIQGFGHSVHGPAAPLVARLIADFAREVEARG